MRATYSEIKSMHKKFCTVNVPGKHGYSFMVLADKDADEDEIIDGALAYGAFDDEDDADYAVVDDLLGEHDIKAFRRYIDLEKECEEDIEVIE